MPRTFITLCVVLFLGMATVGQTWAYTIRTAWLPEHEAFVAWYAQQQGWDREAGFHLDKKNYASGKELMAGTKDGWEIAACGALPALGAPAETPVEIIAIANDESYSTGIYTRASSPILGHAGFNVLFPEISGTPGTVKGKTILCTTGSAAQYTVYKWLKALGLSEKDVVIRDMLPAEALAAFMKGEGDAVALWSPYTLEAENKGLKSEACRHVQPVQSKPADTSSG